MLAVTETAMPGIGLSIPQATERKAMPYVALRASGPMRDLPQFAPRRIEEFFGWAKKNGVELSGPLFFRYTRFVRDGEVELEIGAPVDRLPKVDGDAVASEIPAGRYAQATYTGPYDRLYDAFSMLHGWIKARGLPMDETERAGGMDVACQMESYRIGPMDAADTARFETDILIKLK